MAKITLPEKLTALPPMPEFSGAELKTLKKGKFVKRHEKQIDDDGHPVGKGIAYMIIDHPPQKIWDQILDFASYPKFFPSVSKCKEYNVDGDNIFVEFLLKIGMVIKIRYHIHHVMYPDQSRMTWNVDRSKKNDFKDSIGMWTAWPMEGNKSLIGYTVEIQTGRRVPKFIEDLAAQSGLIKVMEALKKRVNKMSR